MHYLNMRYLPVLLALVPTLALCAPEPLKFPDSPSSSNSDSSIAASSISAEQGARDAKRVIEEILEAARDGRSVGITIGNENLDKLASDPELKKLTSSGGSSNVPEGRSSSLGSSGDSQNVEARNYISTKLCSLGLAKCGEQRHWNGGSGSYNGGSGSYNGIRDVTLVQPVALKPVGHPIAAIPLSPGGRDGSLPFSPITGGGRDKSYDSPYYPSETHQGGFIQSGGGGGCTCVPVSQCNSYDIVSRPGGTSTYPPPYNPSQGGGSSNYYPRPGSDYNSNQGFITGNGRPSYGQVGHGIDPRNKLDSGIESNATIVEAPTTQLNARALPEGEDDVTEAAAGNRTRREAPRVVNGAYNSCYDRQVCCRNPVRPINKQPSTNYPGGPSSYPPPYYPSNNNYPPPTNNNGGVCGKRNAYGINGRVLSGVQSNYGIGNGDTEFGEYPWQVAILRKEGADNVFVCGGSLVDSRHVLTAAHCIQSHRPQTLRVRLGDWDVGGETEFYQHQDLDVAAIAIHPDFNSGNLFNDIALIKLDGYVDTGRYPHISPICLPDKYHEFSGTRCIVTGWGKDAWGHEGKFQHRLKEVDLPVLNHYDCEQKLKRTRLGQNFVLHSGFLCAGGEPSRDACKGDGGGPLACEVRGVWQLAGIISWGVGCGQPDVPGVYVKVSNYHDWIRQNIGY